MSVGRQPTPEVKVNSHELDRAAVIRPTSIYHCQIDAVAISNGSDLVATQWIGIGIGALRESIKGIVTDRHDIVVVLCNNTTCA